MDMSDGDEPILSRKDKLWVDGLVSSGALEEVGRAEAELGEALRRHGYSDSAMREMAEELQKMRESAARSDMDAATRHLQLTVGLVVAHAPEGISETDVQHIMTDKLSSVLSSVREAYFSDLPSYPAPSDGRSSRSR